MCDCAKSRESSNFVDGSKARRGGFEDVVSPVQYFVQQSNIGAHFLYNPMPFYLESAIQGQRGLYVAIKVVFERGVRCPSTASSKAFPRQKIGSVIARQEIRICEKVSEEFRSREIFSRVRLCMFSKLENLAGLRR